MLMNTEINLTYLQEVFRANLLVQQENEKGQKMTALSGAKCIELSKKPNQNGLLLKMLLESQQWNVKRAWKTHSKKPEFFQDLIETVSDAPRLEMFARREHENWDVWGNEVESSVAL